MKNIRPILLACVIGTILTVNVLSSSQQPRPILPENMFLNKVQVGDGGNTVQYTPAENGAMIGYGQTDYGLYGVYQGNGDAILFKRNSSGSISWSHQYGSSGSDAVQCVLPYPNGDIVAVIRTDGDLFGNTPGQSSLYTLKISASGNLAWSLHVCTGDSTLLEPEICDENGILLQMGVEDGDTMTYIHLSNDGSEDWRYVWVNSDDVLCIGRHGNHYRFIQTLNDKTRYFKCIENGQLCNDTVSVSGYMYPEDTVVLDGIVYTLGINFTDTQQNICLESSTTGNRMMLSGLPFNDSHLLKTIGNSGSKAWILVETQGQPLDDAPEGSRDNEDQRSASVYEITTTSATKLFDVFTPPATDLGAKVYRRLDGSFMAVMCWLNGGYGDELQLGTNIRIFTPTGILMGDFMLPEYTDTAFLNSNQSLITGEIIGDDQINDYYATLPTVAAPTFSLAPGTYTGTQSVSISCATTGAVIRYTTDGSEPTEASTQYTAPLSISTNTTVKARAFKTATIPSLRSDAVYTIRKTISGTLTLGNYTGSINGLTASILLRRTDGTPLQTSSATLNSTGAYSFLTEYEGSMEMLVTVPRWLKKKSSLSVTGNTTCNLSLTNGDADGGNSVNLFDYVVLDNAYGTVPGDPSWNFMADLDGGLSVNSFDYTIIDMHFGAAGDN